MGDDRIGMRDGDGGNIEARMKEMKMTMMMMTARGILHARRRGWRRRSHM